ncbi:MAG: hypothetical protein ACE5GB_06980 [Acidimicrobiales bacterium]
MSGFLLDAGARMALDVALGTAGAMGDDRCGTEYLLFGLVATARGDMAELADVFALDTLRLERSIHTLRADWCSAAHDVTLDPPMSERAKAALEAASLSGAQRRGCFDVLVGVLADPASGAATVLRHLGVRIGELRRLAELGAARLGRAEVEGLIAALDRRSDASQPWWGPAREDPVARISLPRGRSVEIARSQSAVATLDGLVAGPDGFGITISLTSRRSWVLPPVWEPREELVAGEGSRSRLEPDVVVIDLRYADGTELSNRELRNRWSSVAPGTAVLVRLGQRTTEETRNDRRIATRRVDTVEWWVWPLPEPGDVHLELSWPAEAVAGTVRIDAEALRRRAETLEVGP